jgi:hypothetical protein
VTHADLIFAGVVDASQLDRQRINAPGLQKP